MYNLILDYCGQERCKILKQMLHLFFSSFFTALNLLILVSISYPLYFAIEYEYIIYFYNLSIIEHYNCPDF